MSRVASAVAVALGKGVERTLTGRTALAYYRALLENTAEPEGRVAAILPALRVAIALGDRAAVLELSEAWAAIPRGVWREEIVRACKELVKAGMTEEAAALAGAEVKRHPTAMSLYLWARCSEDAGDAPARYATAMERARREGATDIVDAARRRRAILLARRWETVPEALREATALDLRETRPRERLAVAGILLGSPSRFVRATAIGVLDELVTTERRDATLAADAIRAAARFADERGAGLTPLETERLAVLFARPYAVRHAPGALGAMKALDALLRASPTGFDAALADVDASDPALAPLHARARDITAASASSGLRAAPRPPDPPEETRVAHRILDAASALREGNGARAAEVLRELAPITPAPRALLGVAHAALLQEAAFLQEAALLQEAQRGEASRGLHTGARDAAVALFAAHLRAPTMVAPPRGWTALAQALALAGAADLAELARHAAAAAREPGAVEALGVALARAGWALAARGDGEGALAKLREAKARSHDER